MLAHLVADISHIAETRRAAVDTATNCGFDETQAGRVAIVATELATNILRHGGGGEILVGCYEDPSGTGVELIALDKGPGIANLEHSLRDGFSTAGSSGHGLGAIRRQSQVMEVASWPDLGTAILARIEKTERNRNSESTSMPPWGCVSVPMPSETVCGDACDALDGENGRSLIVADGLGHGSEAATAAVAAIRLFKRHQSRSVAELLQYLHAGLRATRGAAVAVARFDHGAGKLTYGGVGNISAAIIDGTEIRRMVSLNGTAGHNARRIQTFDYPYRQGLVVMVSDGLTSGWSLSQYPGIGIMHPTLIAAILYRDFARRRDDATVLVARGVAA
jgi:anti-sigma regulatory factor (Ser/Thr protein kinase)